MKVCDVVKDSIWYDPRVKKQIEEYLRNDIDLNCVGSSCPRYDIEEIKKIPCKCDISLIGQKYYSKKRNIFTKVIRELKTNKDIYKLIINNAPNIIHANDLNALIPAYRASKKLKCKLIYDTHEIFIENQSIASNKLVKFVWGFYERKIIKKVNYVVCVSNAAAEYIKNKYKIKNVIVVTNCVNKIDVSEIPKSNKFEILNHGQFYEGRGYDIMVDAAKQCINDKIEFVLRGFGHMEADLRQKVINENIENVRFDKPVKVEELIPMAARSSVGLAITVPYCINFKLSISNKFFEYAAAGLPLIMSDIPEHKFLNDKYQIGIILPENTPEELNKAIEKLYNDREFYKKCCENVKLMSNEINWETEFKNLIEIEEKLLGDNK